MAGKSSSPTSVAKTRNRDGALSGSSEIEVRTHQIPGKERTLKSFFHHSCSFRCSELVERRQRAGGQGVDLPLAIGTFKICKFFLSLEKLTFVCVCVEAYTTQPRINVVV